MHGHPAVAQQLHDETIAAAGQFAAINEQHHHIHLADGPPGALHQPFAQQVMGFVDAWGVNKHQLGRGRGQDPAQAIAGGLGHGRGDRHLFAYQVVEQGRFAHVGAPDQGDKARAETRRARAKTVQADQPALAFLAY